jgi:hypothetical protein
VIGGTGGGTGIGDPALNPDVTGTVVDVAAYRSPNLMSTLAPVVVLELLALVILPPLAYIFWSRRRKAS